MKFKKRKQRKNITYNTIVIVLTFIMCFLSVGYCAMSSVDVFESPKVLVSPKADARITNLELSSTSNGGISKSEDYNIDRIYGLIDLPNIDSTVTYKVDITVFLSIEMQLDNIKVGDLVEIKGEVSKRFDKFQIIINNIKKLGDK